MCLPRCVDTDMSLTQAVYSQHFIIVIYKATCFGCTRQLSSGFAFQKYIKKEILHFRNLQPDYGCLVRPKHVASPPSVLQESVVCRLVVLLLHIDRSLPTSLQLLYKLLFPTSKFHVLFLTQVTDPYTSFLIHVPNPAQFGYSMAHLYIPNLFFRTSFDTVSFLSALLQAPYFCPLQQSRFEYGLINIV